MSKHPLLQKFVRHQDNQHKASQMPIPMEHTRRCATRELEGLLLAMQIRADKRPH